MLACCSCSFVVFVRWPVSKPTTIKKSAGVSFRVGTLGFFGFCFCGSGGGGDASRKSGLVKSAVRGSDAPAAWSMEFFGLTRRAFCLARREFLLGGTGGATDDVRRWWRCFSVSKTIMICNFCFISSVVLLCYCIIRTMMDVYLVGLGY